MTTKVFITDHILVLFLHVLVNLYYLQLSIAFQIISFHVISFATASKFDNHGYLNFSRRDISFVLCTLFLSNVEHFGIKRCKICL